MHTCAVPMHTIQCSCFLRVDLRVQITGVNHALVACKGEHLRGANGVELALQRVYSQHIVTIQLPYSHHTITVQSPYSYHTITIHHTTTIQSPYKYHTVTIQLPYRHDTVSCCSRQHRRVAQCVPGKHEDQHKHSQQHEYKAASANAK